MRHPLPPRFAVANALTDARLWRTRFASAAHDGWMTLSALSATRAGDVVGGYRLLRKLGDGSRAEVFLGYASTGHTAVVKVYRPDVPASVAEAELLALSRAAHAHTVQVRDVASLPGGAQCLILERLELGSLARLLAARSQVHAGEALTILAPLGAAIDAMHASGVAHGGVGAGSVLFRATGAPVLACFGEATVFDAGLTPAKLARQAAVLADRAAFARLAAAVLDRRPPDRRVRAIVEWLAAQGDQGFPDAIGEVLAERLFDVTDAAPVWFEWEERSALGVPARAVTAEPVPETPPAAPITRALGLPTWVSDALENSPVALLRSHMRGVRRRVWLVAGGVALALCVAIVVVPTDAPLPSNPGSSAPAPAGSEPAASESTETPVAIEQGAVAKDDPLAALELLLVERERCIRDLSVLCLDAVDQAGSAALADDTALVRAIQNGGESAHVALNASGAELVERIGDSAIVRLTATDPETQPASLLLMKGEAGWRIRGYLR